ncbi:hypothetical protein Bca52824_066494 [Brassica carinata]|uniref:Uncharacterized protein n=1 Tax=Brassica carinata TaxID=52824 RepID=A0A8X7QK92_BRACI|nr:hypothetical protein Bca52824_066494 [Brassica carinata]
MEKRRLKLHSGSSRQDQSDTSSVSRRRLEAPSMTAPCQHKLCFKKNDDETELATFHHSSRSRQVEAYYAPSSTTSLSSIDGCQVPRLSPSRHRQLKALPDVTSHRSACNFISNSRTNDARARKRLGSRGSSSCSYSACRGRQVKARDTLPSIASSTKGG